jgi:sulfate transport system permease protein
MNVLSKRPCPLIPGFHLTLGFTLLYLSLIVLIPLAMLFVKSSSMGWTAFVAEVSSARALAAYRLSFGASAVSASINAVFGLLTAWVLVRYPFPGKRFVNAMIDLPFALPTAVAGIALTAIYAPNGWIGQWCEPLGIKTAFSPIGIMIALTFTGLPFVVRSVEPVLEDLDQEIEAAAFSLGANRWQTFRRVLFPLLMPSVLTGTAMAFARALGEYGSVVFISGNMPMKTEIVPLLIITKLEQYDYEGAMAIAIVMLLISFFILLGINVLHKRGFK